MQLYRYSPIKTHDELMEAVSHVAKQAAKLYFRATGSMDDNLIESLTVFSHYPDEYDDLIELVQTLGDPYNENNGPRVKLHNPIAINLATIERDGKKETSVTSVKYLRVRKPDPYRMQVGCCDLEDSFETQDFWSAFALPNDEASPRLIRREEYDMLEFFAPDIDVLAYIVENR